MHEAVRERATYETTDFFHLNVKEGKWAGGFDFVYDYTFLCALQPEMRDNWAATHKFDQLSPIQSHHSSLVFHATAHCGLVFHSW